MKEINSLNQTEKKFRDALIALEVVQINVEHLSGLHLFIKTSSEDFRKDSNNFRTFRTYLSKISKSVPKWKRNITIHPSFSSSDLSSLHLDQPPTH
jgi:hypothetical protein